MAEIIHRKKLFDGRPAAEVYAETAWSGAKCTGCGAKPPAIRVQVFVALSDMSVTVREAVLYEIAFRRVSTVKTVRGEAVRTSEAYACRLCAASLERTVARHAPSYALVDFERGPGPDNPIVGVIADVS
jgi:hypothetical protein